MKSEEQKKRIKKKTGAQSGAPAPRVPWTYWMQVKDMVNPITISRMRIVQFSIGLLLVAATAFFIWQEYFRPASGEEMVQQMVEAAGGMEAWNAVKGGQFDRTKTLYGENGEQLSQKVETFFFRKTNEGVKLMVKSQTEDDEEVWIGKDQDGYWASKDKEAVDPKLTARGLGMMCDSKWCEPLCASSMAFYRFSMPFKLTDPGVIPQNEGLHMLGGLESQVLDITYEPEVGKDRWVFYTDPNDMLIRKLEYHHTTDEGDSRPEEIYWSDYRTVAGITFAHNWTRYWSNGKVMEEYTYSNVDFGSQLAEHFFDRPEDHMLAVEVE